MRQQQIEVMAANVTQKMVISGKLFQPTNEKCYAWGSEPSSNHNQTVPKISYAIISEAFFGRGQGLARIDGRANNEIRPTTITLGAQAYAEGSVLIETGMTKVLCAVSVENGVPPFLRGSGKGWVTSE